MEERSWNDSTYYDTFLSRDSLDVSRGQLKELKIGCDHNHETRFGAVADSGYRDSLSLQSLNNCGSSHTLSCKAAENDNNIAISQKQNKLSSADCLDHEDLENRNPLVQLNDKKVDISRSPMATLTGVLSKMCVADPKSPNIRGVGINSKTSTPCCQYRIASGQEQILAIEIDEDLSPLSYPTDKSIEDAYTESPKKLFKRLSQQFTASPQRFTQRLKTVIEETLSHSDFEKAELNDVSMRRITQEFRKICNEHHSRIDDESMPAYNSISCNDTPEQLKRPMKFLTMLDEEVGSPLNNTASFIYWENKCKSECSPVQRKQNTIDSLHCLASTQDQSFSAEMKTGRARENLLKFIQSLIRSSRNVPASPTEKRHDFLTALESCAKSLTGEPNLAASNNPLDCILECTEDTGSTNSAVNTRITSDILTPNNSPLSNSRYTTPKSVSSIVQSNEALNSPAISLTGSRNQLSKVDKSLAEYSSPKSSPAKNPNRTPKYPFIPKIVKPATPPHTDKKTYSPSLLSVNNGLREQASSPRKNETQKSKFKYFPTPGRTPPINKSKPKKKYFENPLLSPSPRASGQPKTNTYRSSPYRLMYNAVTSPVGTYIRGMDTKLIQNVNARTNDMMLTPTTKRPITKSNAVSTLLPSSGYKDSTRLKFKLSPSTASKQSRKEDIFNTAMCESDTSSCTQSTCASLLPKVYYQPSTYMKTIKSDIPKSPGRALIRCQDKMIYRHEGRVKSSIPTKSPSTQVELSFEDTISADSADVSVVHQRPAVKTNYLCK